MDFTEKNYTRFQPKIRGLGSLELNYVLYLIYLPFFLGKELGKVPELGGLGGRGGLDGLAEQKELEELGASEEFSNIVPLVPLNPSKSPEFP